MKIIELRENAVRQNSASVISLLQSISLYHGKTYDLPKIKGLNRLHSLSKRRSSTASNAIEGIKVTPRRENDLFELGKKPEVYEDYMLTGYNKALERVISSYRYQSLDEAFILSLHRFLYEGFSPDFGGKYKDTQNWIVDGTGKILFTPSRPEEVPQLMGNLLYQYSLCHRDPVINPLILDAVFILDFLCIHPFNDGNGRVSRLLTTFLLLKDGYPVDLYDSVSYRILQHREEYYQALSSSDQGWEKGKNDPSSFVLFFLRMILESYQKLDERIELFKEKATAAEKVRKVILASEIPVSKADIEETLFFYSRTTIEKALGDLLKAKEIQMVQSGHYAKYYRP